MKCLKIVFICFLTVTAFSCKNGKKESNAEQTEKTKHYGDPVMFSLVNDSTKVSFTAYKTTEKKPVNGVFKKINITNTHSGPYAKEVLNEVEFSIPISSLFTNDATGTRDPKLLEFFFGMMKNTTLISGVFKVDDGECSINVTMNGETANIPLTLEKHETKAKTYTLSGVMNLENWKALGAVAALNKACEALHTGADGVSKTWSEVAVKAEVLLRVD